MRMWMLPPRQMCRKHLLGEHVEIHMAAASLRLGKNLEGFLERGLLELGKLRRRHDALAAEMLRRGYRHNSPLPVVNGVRRGKVDLGKSARDLRARCKDCRELLSAS
ncbi:MAG TPA: pyrimidine dimer DNA glycosylase/endonuclease V [Terriglobales bacterium]|nr:pyrimidine dimer DNA glycosylase/endonuclease V [Terriglobales bacterium]